MQEVVAAIAALPAAVRVCEALGVGSGSQLRATVWWQLSGQLTTAPSVSLGAVEPLLGEAPFDHTTSNAGAGTVSAAHEVGGVPGLSWRAGEDAAEDVASSQGMVVQRMRTAFVQLMPRWTTALSCALVLLAGAAINV